MKLYTPSYYEKFKCIADKCRHSCCVGWDVYIDPDSLVRYRSIPGAIGKRLTAAIKQNSEGAYFEMRSGRCPFLNDSGLCDLITELGEESLSEICAEHPRYYCVLGDKVYGGLGMSCEEAARLILTEDDSAEKTSVTDAEGFLPTECDEAFAEKIMSELLFELPVGSYDPYSFLCTVVSHAKMLDGELFLGAEERKNDPGSTPCDVFSAISTLKELFLPLEYMSDELPALISDINPESLRRLTEAECRYLGRVAFYLARRYYPSIVSECDPLGVAAFILAFVAVLALLFASRSAEADLSLAVELCRLLSAEIEYSEDNVSRIMGCESDRLTSSVLFVVKNLM